MAQIPQFNREQKLNGAALPYENLKTAGAFDEEIIDGKNKFANAVNNFNKEMINYKNGIDETKILELSNQVEQWSQSDLYDKDNGYFYTTGKTTVGKGDEVMKNFDTLVGDYIKSANLSPQAKKRAQDMVLQKRTRILNGVNAHELKQAEMWSGIEADNATNNAVNGMIHGRNNEDEIRIHLNTGIQALKWKGQIQRLDEDTINATIRDFISKGHEAVLNAKINDGDLSAKDYYELHKDEIRAEVQPEFINSIRNQKLKYDSKYLADEIIAMSANEEDAVKRAEQIKDIDLSERTISKIRNRYSINEAFKNDREKELLNGFYQKAINAAQTGGELTFDDIPEGLDASTKYSLMNFINSKGKPETNNYYWHELYYKSIDDAQGFIKEDLNKYRGYLSESDYETFLKRQEEIRKGDFYTVLKDDNKMIETALKTLGLDKNSFVPFLGDKKDIVNSEIRSYVHEFEARKGRKITDTELADFLNSLGYKEKDGVKLYKAYEKGMREKVGFMRDVVNDFTYYQRKHNGQLPSDTEKVKIINSRLNKKLEDNKTDVRNTVTSFKSNAALQKGIASITAKPNEQKTLTYFADYQIPQIEKNTGLKIVVTSRYRNQKGSHHGEGRAADVSMSQYVPRDRIKITKEILDLPYVYKVGTSDPAILNYFGKHEKIENETEYDKKRGTNHKNHIHVTLVNYNPTISSAGTKQNQNYSF